MTKQYPNIWWRNHDRELSLDTPVLTKPLSSLGRLGRIALKRFMYSQMAIRTGFMIAIGKEQPLVQFTVEKDPPSIYWVYRIKSSMIEGLREKLGIPSHFSLCPIRCLETDEPEYLLTVNAYRVSGLANGIRAEWSIFVRDHNDVPRYMVVDARSSQYSLDPVSIITKSSTVIHEKHNNRIQTQIGEEDIAFKSTIQLPTSSLPVTPSPEWVSANDYIYWGNGICDRTFYNAGLANSQIDRCSSDNYRIKDKSFWGQVVEPEPVHVLILNNALEFVISPWENVDKAPIRRPKK
ncbi:MAG: hypothetical protein GWN62_06965 [Aliifodinibius sp.]|nr:hypothetical protein [Fodinibius sp.]